MIYNTLVFTEALEQVDAIVASKNSDEITDRIIRISKDPDLAMACMLLFTFRAKGIDTSELTGVDLANSKPTVNDLVFPPGVRL